MTRQPHRQRLIRQVRLQRLLGRSIVEIAAQVGRGASTVWRVIRDNGLNAPEMPLERQRLSLSEGTLFRRQMIDDARVSAAPILEDVDVAVDPPATSGPAADACGIIAAGVREGVACVLADASAPGLKPLDWARRAVAVCREVGAREIIAESDQGGEMVQQVLESAGADVPVRLAHARLGKRARAAPVATLYQQGRVAHVGLLPTLEDQKCQFGVEGFRGSPDRVDALV